MSEAVSPLDWLTRLLVLADSGRASLPTRLGLGEAEYQALRRRCGLEAEAPAAEVVERQGLLGELLALRREEQESLTRCLQAHELPEAAPMATIVAGASLGFNHLWQDLGLDSRLELRALMRSCFPELVVLNHSNMRWKKFFYRQLCEQEGHYLCRSPSCDDCHERASCFEPSD